ncbi:MAG TPA: hypothetical protein ENN99_12605 [Chloroflexi bacterium]|nr:hypothetical protein [Chloroflexota bacterium]
MDKDRLEQLRAVKSAHEADLMHKPHVVGVGIGLRQIEGQATNEPAIVVSVDRKLPLSELDDDDVIPRELEGFPVDVQVIGRLWAF